MLDTQSFTISIVIAISYFILKFLEMRVIMKKNESLKNILRETLLVYFSSIAGFFIYQQISPVKEIVKGHTPTVFTGEPEF